MEENLKLAGFAKGMGADSIEKHMEFFLNHFRLKDYKDTKARVLSTGSRQKLKLIISMLSMPRLLILESPAEGLDHFSSSNLWKVLLALSRR